MWNFIAQPGIATASVDFTNELSMLEVGLGGLIWLSVGLIVFVAIQDYLFRATKPVAGTTPIPVDYREAA